MKHLAAIFSEFIKQARKWKDLSYEDQKGYLSRHPASKRKITAKPEGAKSKDDDDERKKTKEDGGDESSEGKTYAEFAEKLSGESKSSIKERIVKLEAKMQSRIDAAARREQRAGGNLDGTAFEAANERNEPLDLEVKLLKHYLQHGDKKLPEELQSQFDSIQQHKKYKNEQKEEAKKEKEKYADLIGKEVTWKSRKNFGQEMTGIVTKVKVSRRGGIMVSTDTGWRVPVDLLIKNKTKTPRGLAGKELVTAKDLIGKKVSWKTKYTPGWKKLRGFGGYGARIQRSEPPGWDSETGTASGKVTEAKGSKVVVGSWRIPLSLLKTVDGKEFQKWK